ncbi:MAG: hypothetical protein ACFFDO_07890 [Candidatus Thorarchaeota archaeon]
MCPMYEGFPAVIYSGLWILRTFRRLEKVLSKLPINIVILLTDSPPAFMVRIDKENFEIEILEHVENPKELDDIECDGYLALPTEILYKGPAGIRDAIAEKKLKINNYEIITVLAKLTGFG